MVSTPNSQSIRLKRQTGEAWDFQQRIFIALKILNLFVILSGQKTLLACLCMPEPLELGELCVCVLRGGGAALMNLMKFLDLFNLFVTSKIEFSISPILQFSNLKCHIEAKEPFQTPF